MRYQRLTTIEKEIHIARQSINEHFDRLERELLRELQTTENNERKKISKILASVERKEKEIYELQASLALIKKHASDLQTFLVSKQIEHELVDTDSVVQSMQDNNELLDVNISLKTDNTVKGVNIYILRFGNIVGQGYVYSETESQAAQANVADPNATTDNNEN
ncbi:unnamed protein product [Mytilus coruscus]|uniref:Uncharacterized protein n=1 Tax=Mytilus coruscus TaxID=42192 RepID=A0A6J8E4E4_MYTCO|nr:unnamed protein product [Mytilus coruscus]